MFTVKFLKHTPNTDSAASRPLSTEHVCIRQARSVHASLVDGGKTIVQLGDAPNETEELTIGPDDYSVAYVMNESGRTVETFR